MTKIMMIAATLCIFAGCTGQREMYNKNGLTLVQVGADPTPLNGGYNVLIAETNGKSHIIAMTSTGTVAEQLAMPAAVVGAAAALRPTEINQTSNETTLVPQRIRQRP